MPASHSCLGNITCCIMLPNLVDTISSSFFISGKFNFCTLKTTHQSFFNTKPRLRLLKENVSTIRGFPVICSNKFGDKELQFPQSQQQIPREEAKQEKKSFWAAVSLIIGTAIGPGMLGLPAVTISSGPLPSTVAIFLSWIYVISSILLVAELSFVTMEEDGLDEVSFTGLATKAFGTRFGALVSIVYASLSVSLLIACVSGIGSIVSNFFPTLNVIVAHALFPLTVASLLWFSPFQAIDVVNRGLCLIMFVSITALVGIGLSMSMARASLLQSFSHASWSLSSVLPAIPVVVLTLGFHVITPFICRIAGETVHDAFRAILVGGAVPLIMILSWNMIVQGLAGMGRSPYSYSGDPISLLLSVKSSALFAVQAFAFSALGTSLIGYAVSFPKQLMDTLELLLPNTNSVNNLKNRRPRNENGDGRVGFGTYYSGAIAPGKVGNVLFHGPLVTHLSWAGFGTSDFRFLTLHAVLIVSIVVASFCKSTFSKALDFAGVYANCFLFGILPPLMTFIYKSKEKLRSSILPGGDAVLLLLFSIALILADGKSFNINHFTVLENPHTTGKTISITGSRAIKTNSVNKSNGLHATNGSTAILSPTGQFATAVVWNWAADFLLDSSILNVHEVALNNYYRIGAVARNNAAIGLTEALLVDGHEMLQRLMSPGLRSLLAAVVFYKARNGCTQAAILQLMGRVSARPSFHASFRRDLAEVLTAVKVLKILKGCPANGVIKSIML
ncbi:hypothetical protein Nepgr_030852 [Nepenthes gracilis]|uniref:Tyrosine-specific transport protein n=1 Tax=Nepenthes gracilis TaxID=150966 RepID=A0AAD3Y6G8_NEPGR|nr:hypothetical protein Nepgr_030852 [Nepenthes gracilis]